METYCLDTSVLIDCPNIFDEIEKSILYIPYCVLFELDNQRHREGIVGKNSRQAVRNLDGLLLDSKKKTKLGSIVKFIDSAFVKETNDLRIIECAKYIKNNDKDICILSNDLGLRIQAGMQGIKAKEYKNKSSKLDLETKTIPISQDLINKFYVQGFISLNDIKTKDDFYINQTIILLGEETNSSSLGRIVSKNSELIIQKIEKQNPFGLKPANLEQILAIELLQDRSVELVSLIGKAGSGKSLLSLACGLQQVVEQGRYKKLVILRPIVEMGKSIGYLPGSEQEKLEPWTRPIMDNLLVLCNGNTKMVNSLIENGTISIEAMPYIRGRSIPDSYIMIDEAQNLYKEELKTILTRAAVGSKIVLTGDVEQIDIRNLDPETNGLSFVIDKFKGNEIAGNIILNKSQRSKIAALASQIL